jgi:hypothetical protein
MTLLATRDKRLAVTLVKIKKLTLSMQIGPYYSIFVASLNFGTSVIIPKLRLNILWFSAWKSRNIAIRSSLMRLQKT